MSKFANFVQCTLAAAITAGATSIEVQAESPYSVPPDPGGDVAYITLMDSLNGPSEIEIVSYTGRTTIDATTVELTGVARAQQGTSARVWPAGTFARQDITSAQLGLLELPSIGLWVGFNDNSVRRFTTEGIEVWANGSHAYPIRHIAVDYDGTSYSISADLNGANGVLIRVDPNGNMVWSESLAVTVGFLGNLVVSKDGFIYYALGQEVAKYDKDGTQVWTYATGFDIRDMDVDRDGNVFVTDDDGLSTLLRLYPDGTKAWEVTMLGTLPGVAVSVSSGFHVWVSDVDQVFRYDYQGSQIGSGTLEAGIPVSLTALDDGSVIVSKGSGGWRKLDETGAEVWVQPYTPGQSDPVGGTEEVVVDAEGFIYGAALTDDLTIKVDPDDGSILFASNLNVLDSATAYGAYDTGMGDPIFQDGFEKAARAVRWDDLAGKPELVDQLVFEETAEPATPPSGKATMFLDAADGNLKVKFDNGSVVTIAP